MCPTVFGRVQTRIVTLLGPAMLATIATLVTRNRGWILTIGIFLVMGVALDVLFYPRIVTWQPPWLRLVMAVGEFVILFVLLKSFKPGHPPFGSAARFVGRQDWEPIALYWASWIVASITKIAVLPLVSLTWIENGGEFRRVRWPVDPDRERELSDVLAAPPGGSQPSELLREFLARDGASTEPEPALGEGGEVVTGAALDGAQPVVTGAALGSGFTLHEGVGSPPHVLIALGEGSVVFEALDLFSGPILDGDRADMPVASGTAAGATVLEFPSPRSGERAVAAASVAPILEQPPGIAHEAVDPDEPPELDGGELESSEPPSELDWLLDVRTKRRARMAPLAIAALMTLVVLLYVMATH
jgi:hypothetical protein